MADRVNELIYKYMRENKIFIHPDSHAAHVETAGDKVIVIERESSGYYTEHHTLAVLDIIAWVAKGKGII
jgi:hypothetical protein